MFCARNFILLQHYCIESETAINRKAFLQAIYCKNSAEDLCKLRICLFKQREENRHIFKDMSRRSFPQKLEILNHQKASVYIQRREYWQTVKQSSWNVHNVKMCITILLDKKKIPVWTLCEYIRPPYKNLLIIIA